MVAKAKKFASEKEAVKPPMYLWSQCFSLISLTDSNDEASNNGSVALTFWTSTNFCPDEASRLGYVRESAFHWIHYLLPV